MRSGIVELTRRHRDLLSNDLGAAAALLFDIGIGRYAPAPREATGDAAARRTCEEESTRIREAGVALDRNSRALAAAREGDRTRTAVQQWLRDLGLALGNDVWIACQRSGAGLRIGTPCRRLPGDAPDGAHRRPGIRRDPSH